MNEGTVVPSKKGRKSISGESMSAAQRQRRARSLAMKQLCDGNEKDISTSGLIALLPTLVSSQHGSLVKTVCNEIARRYS